MKLCAVSLLCITGKSPPTRRCGLKLYFDVDRFRLNDVTSYAEVWIETADIEALESGDDRHLLRGGVD